MTKKKNKKTLIIVLVAVVVVLVVAVSIKNKNKPSGEKVAAEEVTERTIIEKVAASGRVFPQTEVKISSDVSGEIVELYVQEGDSVVTGQILARIDPDAYQSQVERGVASVNSAKAQLANSRSQVENAKAQKEQILAQLENAQAAHTRNEALKADKVISDADFDQSLSALRALEANLRSSEASIRSAEENVRASEFSIKSAEASLKELQTSLRRTTIYAPMDGNISSLSVERGERVVGTIQMTGTEMMRIANLNAMEVRVDVSENDIPRVKYGDEVEIEVDAYIDRKFKGTVTQIANSSSNAATVASLTSDQVSNFEVRINIDPSSYEDLIQPNNPFPFRPGMSASVEINTEKRAGVLSVPILAVTTREKEGEDKKLGESNLEEVVFLVMGDTVAMKSVETGIQDDKYIEIIGGLNSKEKVVSAPYNAISRKLKSGSKIQVVEENELYNIEGSKE
ncbi:MAG: HlyD family secretion protein [Saprospiraceae bacterium]|jgi:HlyD family secretion protein